MKELILEIPIIKTPEPSDNPSKLPTVPHIELLTEYFGVSPIEIVDDIINTVNDLLYKAMDRLENLVSKLINNPQEIEKGMAAIETLFENAIDKYFDKFELYCMTQIFVLPHQGHVLLPHYDGLDLNTSIEDELKLDKEIAEKRQAVINAKYFNFKMQRELESIDVLLIHLIKLKDNFNSLKKLQTVNDICLQDVLDVLSKSILSVKNLSSSVRARTQDVSFRDICSKNDDRSRYLKSSISNFLENQHHMLNSLAQTPRKRRQSNVSCIRTPGKQRRIRTAESMDCSVEYKGAMQIGTARNVQVLRDLLEDNEME